MAFGLSNITYVNIARGRRSINLPCLGRDCNCKNGERILRFMMTLSMPSFSNNLVHQVICDHDSTSLQEFTELLNDTDFVTVHQYYNVKDEASGERDWEYKGELTINTSLIGKVQVYVDKNTPVERYRRETTLSLRPARR